MRQFQVDQRTNALRPQITVDYYRMAYVHDLGQLRVTLDTDLAAGALARLEIHTTHAGARIEQSNILELKYTTVHPSFIPHAIAQSFITPTCHFQICALSQSTGNASERVLIMDAILNAFWCPAGAAPLDVYRISTALTCAFGTFSFDFLAVSETPPRRCAEYSTGSSDDTDFNGHDIDHNAHFHQHHTFVGYGGRPQHCSLSNSH